MNQNQQLSIYPQSEVENLFKVGKIESDIDEHANLFLEYNSNYMASSSITIPLQNKPCNIIKVETKYKIQFTEL